MCVLRSFFISTNHARLKLTVNILKTVNNFFVDSICLTNSKTVMDFITVLFFRSLVTNALFNVDLLCCCCNTSHTNYIQSFQ